MKDDDFKKAKNELHHSALRRIPGSPSYSKSTAESLSQDRTTEATILLVDAVLLLAESLRPEPLEVKVETELTQESRARLAQVGGACDAPGPDTRCIRVAGHDGSRISIMESGTIMAWGQAS